MAHTLLFLPAVLSFAMQGVQESSFDEGRLVIEWRNQTLLPQENKVVFTGSVKATYGVTTLTCDRLTLFFSKSQQSGEAEGLVHIEDPEGTIDAAKLQFNWRDHTGEADLVTVDVDPMMRMEAQKLRVVPGEWQFSNVKITECGIRTPLLTMWSPSVTIRPGKESVARRVTMSILGMKVATLRRQNLTAKAGSRGIRLPSVSIRRGQGLGVTWQGGAALTNSTYTDFRFVSFPHRRPSLNLSISRSLLNPDKVEALLTPRSDLSELFNYGYLENINVENPQDERNYLSHDRLTVSVGSVINAGVSGRTGRDSLTKPWDLTLEHGGTHGGFSMINQARYQRMELIGERKQTRGVVISSILSPEVKLGNNLSAAARGDGRWFFNEGGQAKWGRISAELNWNPNPKVRLGAGYSFGSNEGDFPFEFDRLPRSRTIHVRSDLLAGPTKLYLLGKYDPERKDWFDYEFAVYQLAGCFEPYYIFRRTPGTSSFGVRFRVFEAFDNLRERVPKRTKGNMPLPDEKVKPPHRIFIG